MNTSKKYGKSKNGNQCIGPCFEKNVTIIHPIYLDHITNDEPFCPTNMFTDNKGNKMYKDTCLIPTQKKYLNNEFDNIANNFTIDFDGKYFLTIYYNIFSFEDSLEWIYDNNYYPTETKKRIINVSLSVYGKGIEIVDHRFIDYFINIISSNIDKIYKNTERYIGKKGSDILLVKTDENDLSYDEYKLERINYLFNIFINQNEIYKFIIKYFKNRIDKWDEINDHLKMLENDLIDYIINKIKLTLKL